MSSEYYSSGSRYCGRGTLMRLRYAFTDVGHTALFCIHHCYMRYRLHRYIHKQHSHKWIAVFDIKTANSSFTRPFCLKRASYRVYYVSSKCGPYKTTAIVLLYVEPFRSKRTLGQSAVVWIVKCIINPSSEAALNEYYRTNMGWLTLRLYKTRLHIQLLDYGIHISQIINGIVWERSVKL